MTSTSSLPLTEIVSPDDPAALAATVAHAHGHGTPIYPLGGQTSLNYGARASRPGIGLSLGSLAKIIDYPARDMTVTVEAGVKLSDLARVLAAERQWLPVSGPRPEQATIGGLMATAWSDGRRYGWGTMRDYVIGVHAVDGRGMAFKAGGRVVKNVAGYDLCKLLTGSLGTLGVITAVTLKLKPLPERSTFVAVAVSDLEMAETILARLAATATSPAAIELLAGPAWRNDPAFEPLGPTELGYLVVGLDGAAAEVEWMVGALGGEWRPMGVERVATIEDKAIDDRAIDERASEDQAVDELAIEDKAIEDRAAAGLWTRLRDFSAASDRLTLKASVAPSRVCQWIAECRRADSRVDIQAHAGSGIVLARFAEDAFAPGNGKTASIADLLSRLRKSAAGHVSVVSTPTPDPLSNELIWGPCGTALDWMNNVKQQFDPRGILNPGRFMFGSP